MIRQRVIQILFGTAIVLAVLSPAAVTLDIIARLLLSAITGHPPGH